ncbi:Uu.00g123380.m01.CDS01 [Anthostomella pinea]|uniref:Uu.00g123380.m01.CDS01 n=1 Tax=Anthostomella pinea TaxID=933095 RepID=A0AAI8VIE6_9PEZI|nr:Uu.00g123380.m01.CDS01 [Anthostomella pinea]
MAPNAPIEALVTVKQTPELGPDTYVNVNPMTSQQGVRSVFGGAVVGLSVAAAFMTLPPEFSVHSLQSTFIRAVKPMEVVHFHVERTSDGRSFASRVVHATQGAGDACVHISTVCFQRNDLPVGNVLDYAVAMPDVNSCLPDDIPREKLQEAMTASITRDVPLLQLRADEEPFDWRPFDNTFTDQPTHYRQRSFVRSPTPLPDNMALHQNALAYLSDTYMLGAALNASPSMVGRKLQNVAMATSLNHTLWLHEPTAKVDEWMLGERVTSWGSNGRVLIHQRFWNVRSGRLVMSGTQEGLIRLKNAKL